MTADLKVPEKCPRCGGTHFTERSTGPDERYLAFDCKKCELVYSRWADQWYLSQEEDEEYAPETEVPKADPKGKAAVKPIVFCPWCSHPDRNPQRHFSDAGDDDMNVKCGSCGKQYTILKRIIVVEYSVKEVS